MSQRVQKQMLPSRESELAAWVQLKSSETATELSKFHMIRAQWCCQEEEEEAPRCQKKLPSDQTFPTNFPQQITEMYLGLSETQITLCKQPYREI